MRLNRLRKRGKLRGIDKNFMLWRLFILRWVFYAAMNFKQNWREKGKVEHFCVFQPNHFNFHLKVSRFFRSFQPFAFPELIKHPKAIKSLQIFIRFSSETDTARFQQTIIQSFPYHADNLPTIPYKNFLLYSSKSIWIYWNSFNESIFLVEDVTETVLRV